MKKLFLFYCFLTLFCSFGLHAQDLSKAPAVIEGFKNTGWQSLSENTIKMIGTDWMLICAGNISSFNMMTASWGGLGWLWEKPVTFIFVRPQRYTHQFTEKEDYFTHTFPDIRTQCAQRIIRRTLRTAVRNAPLQSPPAAV
ncbi:MAG: hypothetical protein PHR81_11080, partial [Bacteroidales bacterium]|nr:hypothetical protein [Bacteroidales bacterium]